MDSIGTLSGVRRELIFVEDFRGPASVTVQGSKRSPDPNVKQPHRV